MADDNRFYLFFRLKKKLSLEENVVLSELNIIHPSDTFGAFISRVGRSRTKVNLVIPRLNAVLRLNVLEKDSDNVENRISFFNMAASLQVCIIIISFDGTELEIQLVPPRYAEGGKVELLHKYYDALFN